MAGFGIVLVVTFLIIGIVAFFSIWSCVRRTAIATERTAAAIEQLLQAGQRRT